MSEVLQYRFPDRPAGDGDHGLAGHAARQPADRRDDRGRGRRLRGRRPADEPDPRGSRPGPAGLADADHAARPHDATGPSSTASRTSCGRPASSASGSAPRTSEHPRMRWPRSPRPSSSSSGPGSLYTSLLPEPAHPGHPRRGPGRRGTADLRLQRRDPGGRDDRLRPRRARRGAGRAHEPEPRRHRPRQQPVGGRPAVGRPDGSATRKAAARPAALATVGHAGAAAHPRRRRRPGQRPPPRPGPSGDCGPLARSRARVGIRRRNAGPDRPAGRPDVTRSERDLVTALRDELAAIDPSRACDRAAEVDGLGPGADRSRGVDRTARPSPPTTGRSGSQPVAVRLGERRRALPRRVAARPLPVARLAQPRRRADRTSSSSSAPTTRPSSPRDSPPSGCRCPGGSVVVAAW